jgi:hypothetical protein
LVGKIVVERATFHVKILDVHSALALRVPRNDGGRLVTP